MGQFTNQGSTADDAEQDASTENHTGDDVHGDVLGKTLEESAEDHGQGADHDGPSAAESLGEPWSNGDGEDGSQLVAGVDKTEKTGLDLEVRRLAWVSSSFTEVFLSCQFLISWLFQVAS